MPANTLRHWRLMKKMDVFQLAAKAKVSDRLIRKIEAESATYVIKSDTMEKLAAALDMPVFAIFFPNDMRVMNGMMSDVVLRNVNRMVHKASLMTCEEVISIHLRRPATAPGT